MKVDAGQIEQTIVNLAVNARDAMPQGGKLMIETANVGLDEARVQGLFDDRPEKCVMLPVTDTGCGINKEVLSQIFEPFFTTKESGKGTGLGLSTVYGIIRQSGGDVRVHSEPGQGTTFKIYLHQTQVEPEADAGLIETDKQAVGGLRILVVEDEASLRGLMEIMLNSIGYQEVVLAASGDEALLLLEKQRKKPDLVITDVVMPGMSGKELVNRLRESLPDIKVLYISGYSDDTIVAETFQPE